ncbi:MAG: LapA family protein [Burkholderiales bacterium]
MKTALWIIKLALFFVALTFAVKNTDSVTVRYYLGAEWQAPLIFVILVVFCLGAAAGVIASLGHLIRLRRELSRLRKQASLLTVTPGESVSPSRAVPSNIPDVV